jgi:mono/diheme cytochrome c family protein
MKPLVWLVSVCAAMMLATDTYAQDEPNALIGSHLYRSYCLVCHGVDGKGAGPIAKNLNLEPADLSSEQYRTRKVEDLAAIIGDYRGRAGAGMPNWGAVLYFTKSENMKKMTDEDLLKIIREGEGDYMPSWKGSLSDNEIADVASYVRMLAR